MPPADGHPGHGPGLTSTAAGTLRADVMDMSRQAERAVTEPKDAGAWPSAWRFAVAARLSTLAGQPAMARAYRERAGEEDVAALADPAFPGRDGQERVVLGFMDKVAREPREVVAGDIEALKAAGVSEPDIVRLCELNAFMAFRCRVVAGLDALNGAA